MKPTSSFEVVCCFSLLLIYFVAYVENFLFVQLVIKCTIVTFSDFVDCFVNFWVLINIDVDIIWYF